MTERIIEGRTKCERDVWEAWSKFGQDLSQPSDCELMLDAIEFSAQQMARIYVSVIRSTCAIVEYNPFVPAPVRGWTHAACSPVTTLAEAQQHVIAAWFGMARQIAASGPPIVRG